MKTEPSIEELIPQHFLDKNNDYIYTYFKEKLGLVHRNYAQKVLGLGEKRFYKAIKEYNVERIKMPSPNKTFETILYRIKDIRELKEKLKLK